MACYKIPICKFMIYGLRIRADNGQLSRGVWLWSGESGVQAFLIAIPVTIGKSSGENSGFIAEEYTQEDKIFIDHDLLLACADMTT
jgi:hypothetical protein